uniref:MARVEL domain-containing protein n=1 Tax=Steinernema glaseri TaxID=37863 RepID=A0A1I7YGY1_9BILA
MHHFDKQWNVLARAFFSLLVYCVVLVSGPQVVLDFSFYLSTVIVGSIALLCLYVGIASNATYSVDLVLFYCAYELFMMAISIVGVISFRLKLPSGSLDNEVFAVLLFIRVTLLIYFVAFALHKVERIERSTKISIAETYV